MDREKRGIGERKAGDRAKRKKGRKGETEKRGSN
jgi:hypothetical protein